MADVKQICDRVTSLITRRFETDAAFERACELSPKTVSNWRRGRSSSFMKMLPRISELLGVDVKELLSGEAKEIPVMTREETLLLEAFRQAREMPVGERSALLHTLLTMIRLSCGGNK